jgi:hypothetical protein
MWGNIFESLHERKVSMNLVNPPFQFPQIQQTRPMRSNTSRWRKCASKRGFIDNCWYALITRRNGYRVRYETGRRTINYAHLVTYFEQESATQLNSPRRFLYNAEGSPPKSYFFNKITSRTKGWSRKSNKTQKI